MTDTPKSEGIATRVRNNFLTGLIICAPMAITIWLTWTFIHWADSWVKPYIPERYNPESYLKFAVPGFGLLIAVVLITIIGFLGKNLIGRSIVNFGESILRRTPMVRTVHSSIKQIFETVLQERSTTFKKVGLIQYPSPGLWSLVFIAGDTKGEIASRFNGMGEEMLTVFLPPTPVPTAGFLLFVPKKDVIVLDMSAEDGAKLLISGGLITPDYVDKTKQLDAEPIKPAKPAKTPKPSARA